jgi:hypothetical protein
MTEKETVSTRWLEDMAFETEIDGHKITIDAKPRGCIKRYGLFFVIPTRRLKSLLRKHL